MALGAPNSVQQGTMHACCTMHALDLCLSNVSGKYACKKEWNASPTYSSICIMWTWRRITKSPIIESQLVHARSPKISVIQCYFSKAGRCASKSTAKAAAASQEFCVDKMPWPLSRNLESLNIAHVNYRSWTELWTAMLPKSLSTDLNSKLACMAISQLCMRKPDTQFWVHSVQQKKALRGRPGMSFCLLALW